MTNLTVLADMGGRVVIVGFLLPLTIVALVAYGALELIRSSGASPATAAATVGPSGPPPVPATSSSALSILDERFARGEIDAEEFVHRRSLLAPPAAPAWNPAQAAAPAAGPDVAPEATDEVAVVEEQTAVDRG